MLRIVWKECLEPRFVKNVCGGCFGFDMRKCDLCVG